MDSFSNESSDCPYERVTESLTHSIHSNVDSFSNESSDCPYERVTESLTRFVQTADSFSNESSDTPYERVTESLTHSIRSNTWIHSVTSQVTVLMNESLNH